MKRIVVLLFCIVGLIYADKNNSAKRQVSIDEYYQIYKNPVAIMPLEKDFIVNLKSPNPESLRDGGFAKLKVSFLLSDKGTAKEIESNLDSIRTIITDIIAGFSAGELLNIEGRRKLADNIVANVNTILSHDGIKAVVFPDFILQP